MALNDLGEEMPARPVTLPQYNLPSVEDADAEETRAAAERFLNTAPSAPVPKRGKPRVPTNAIRSRLMS